LMRAAKDDPDALLALLDDCLRAVAGAGAPAQLVSPSAFALLRKISHLLAHSYVEVSGGMLKSLVYQQTLTMHASSPTVISSRHHAARTDLTADCTLQQICMAKAALSNSGGCLQSLVQGTLTAS